MARLDKLVYTIIRCSIGAAAGLVLLAACAGGHDAQTAPGTGAADTVSQSYSTDYDALYDELADA